MGDIQDYNKKRKRKVLIVFCNKEPFNFLTINTIVNKLFKNFNESL